MTIFDYCDQVKTYIEGIAGGYTVDSVLVQDLSLNQVNKRIVIHPLSVEREFSTRAYIQKGFNIEVNILHKSKTASELKAVVAKAEDIADSILGKTIGNAKVMVQANNPLYAIDDIEQKNVVQSIISLTLVEF